MSVFIKSSISVHSLHIMTGFGQNWVDHKIQKVYTWTISKPIHLGSSAFTWWFKIKLLHFKIIHTI